MARDWSCQSIDELCDLSRGTVRRWALSLDHEIRSPPEAAHPSAFAKENLEDEPCAFLIAYCRSFFLYGC
jgi:hypothetical protein